MASLACLRNSAALVVFGKGLVVLLVFVDVLFNLTGLLPVKQEKSLKLLLTENLENANVISFFFFVITNLYAEIDSFESSFRGKRRLSSFVFFRANSDACKNKIFRPFVLQWSTFTLIKLL